jgi:hypothetical protein
MADNSFLTGARLDFTILTMSQVDGYIKKLAPDQADVVKSLRSLIKKDYPELKEEYKWSQPVYELNKKGVVYIAATKKGVNLGFNQGAHLSDPKGILEGTGKDMRHVKVTDSVLSEIKYLKKLIGQAVKKVK